MMSREVSLVEPHQIYHDHARSHDKKKHFEVLRIIFPEISRDR